MATRGRLVVIGVGNPDRGDDAAGRMVARRLAGRVSGGIEVRECAGEATELLAAMAGASSAVLIDACLSGAPPGTIHRFDVSRDPMPSSFRAWSSHGFGVAEAVELARALGELPPVCIVYGVEGGCFDSGAAPTSEIAGAVKEVTDRIFGDFVNEGP